MPITTSDEYSVANLSDLGDGPGIRKIRVPLGVTAFGVNAIVLPGGYDTGAHAHERQEELYFVHAGRIEIRFGDGTSHVLEAGGMARVAAAMPRAVKNLDEGESVYVVVGAADGYVGRDGIEASLDADATT